MNRLLPALLIVASLVCQTNSGGTTLAAARASRRANEHRLLREYVELLSIPNVASDRENIRRNAAHLVEMMRRRGLGPRLLEASDAAVPPVVYGEWKTPGAARTIALYAHYDGQPTDPRKWDGTEPWKPALRSSAIEAGGRVIPLPKDGEPINPEW